MSRESFADKTFTVFNTITLIILTLIVIYPLIYVASASISDPTFVNSGQLLLFPKDITLEGYERIFQSSEIWMGYRNTFFYTVLGTAIHLAVLLPCAYALSRKTLVGRSTIMMIFLFTMFFNGGLIPTYLLVKNLGMVDTIWALMIPNALGVWGIIVTRAFFQQNVPDELHEAAEMDGCSTARLFVRIVLPISAPIIAVMGLFHGVGLWNQYFNALIYLSNRSLYPLQLILREILVMNQMNMQMLMDGENMDIVTEQARIAEIIKYGVMIVSSLPLLMIYPFLQRYFVKGMLVGSVKG